MNRIVKWFIVTAIVSFLWGCIVDAYGLERYGFVLAHVIPGIIIGTIVGLMIIVGEKKR